LCSKPDNSNTEQFQLIVFLPNPVANTAKNILTLNHEEAMDFFMKSEQYPILGGGGVCAMLAIYTQIVIENVVRTHYAFSHVRNKVLHDIADATKRNGKVLFRCLYSKDNNTVKVTNYD